MKVAVILACVFLMVNGLTDEQKVLLQKHQGECIGSTGVTVDLVKKLHGGDYSTETEPLKKFALCMLIKSQLMTEDGKFRKDIALAKIPVPDDRPEAESLIDGCLVHEAETPEQSSWNFVKCYHGKNPKHRIL